MDIDAAVLAGSISSIIFVGSVLPMVIKAVRTRDMASYSLGNLLLANTGNLIHSVYIYSLPVGPIWVLHGFYVVTTGFMLTMYLLHAGPRPPRQPSATAAAARLNVLDAGATADLVVAAHPGPLRPTPTKEEP